MKNTFLLPLLLLMSLFARSQDPAGEMIKQELSAHGQEDSFRVNRLNEMVFYSNDPNYYLQALSISKKINYPTGEAYALIQLGFAKSRHAARQEGDSMYRRAQSIANQTGNAHLLATLKVYQAYSTVIAEPKAGHNLLLAAEKTCEKSNNKKLLSICQFYIGTHYANARGDLPKGMEYYLKSIHTAEDVNYLRITCNGFIAMGQLYNRLGDRDKSDLYFQKAREANNQLKNPSVEIRLLVNDGNRYKKAGRYTDAINSLTNALQISKDADSVLIINVQNNLADAYNDVDSLSLAFKYEFSSLRFARRVEDYLLLSEVVVPLSATYLKNKMPDSAIYFAKLGYDTSERIGAIDVMRDNAEALANAYAYKKDFANAYSWHLRYISNRDSVLNTEVRNKSAVAQYNDDLDKKQSQITTLNQEKRLQKYFLYGALAVLLLIIITAALLLKSNRQKQRANKLLQEQKQEIQDQRDQINNTLSELQQTQKQLIQSEKMASLGELTAGIAHEIQNPLNFVNNFSEVNNELIAELKSQKSKLKTEEQDEILNDIFQNNEKIAHHGKRADGIVKGMLQHSRRTSTIKEATDINALADEYLRLAYHGLRAKDKSFNATMNVDYDATIGKISIIPQDVGRVLLNLYNNAFYAVNEKAKEQESRHEGKDSRLHASYEPYVSLQTKKLKDKVQIKVSDNGGGIPVAIIDKIFQPFFTTKPTGQGTGLGLSLSYDIVKAHGGEIKVESKQGGGTAFIIQLPD